MNIYDRAKATADRLLSPARLGTQAGAIVLKRKTIIPAANSWDDPSVTVVSEALKAQAFGVSSELVGSPANEPDGPTILASDRMVISAVPVMGYVAGDILAIDGAAVTILRTERIPASGTISAVKFIVRGGGSGAFGGGGDPPPQLPGDDW
jgi:hypothetical protein